MFLLRHRKAVLRVDIMFQHDHQTIVVSFCHGMLIHGSFVGVGISDRVTQSCLVKPLYWLMGPLYMVATDWDYISIDVVHILGSASLAQMISSTHLLWSLPYIITLLGANELNYFTILLVYRYSATYLIVVQCPQHELWLSVPRMWMQGGGTLTRDIVY